MQFNRIVSKRPAVCEGTDYIVVHQRLLTALSFLSSDIPQRFYRKNLKDFLGTIYLEKAGNAHTRNGNDACCPDRWYSAASFNTFNSQESSPQKLLRKAVTVILNYESFDSIPFLAKR